MKKGIRITKILLISLFIGWLGYEFYMGNTYYMGHRSIANSRGVYELVWGDPYDGLNTSLGYEISNYIDSLKSVKWNDRMIVIEQNINKENRWAVIMPKWEKDSILYGTMDTLIRNLTEYQIDSIVKHFKADNFTVEDLKPDIIERCYK